MHQIAALVACVLTGLWLAYLMPHWLRHRQQLLESRADDRYSEALRVVAVTKRTSASAASRHGRAVRPAEGSAHMGTAGLLAPGTRPVAVAVGRTGGDTVDRPHATGEHATTEAVRRVSQIRAARAAAVARRAAAARRRAVLAGVLLVVAVVCWLVVALASAVSFLVGVVPTVLLGAVLVAGRRAVVAGKRNDAALAQRLAQSERVVAGLRTGAVRAVAPATGSAPRADAAAGAPKTAGVAKAADAPKTASVPKATRTPKTASATAAAGAAAAGATNAGAATAAGIPTARAVTAPVASTAAAKAAAAKAASSGTAPMSRPAPVVRATGRAVHPSDAPTQVFTAIVADHGEKGSAARHATGQVPPAAVRGPEAASASPRPVAVAKGAVRGAKQAQAVGAPAGPAAASASVPAAAPPAAAGTVDEEWSPMPVPPPTYTTKPAAPHREPVPLDTVEGRVAPQSAFAPSSVAASSDAISSDAISSDVISSGAVWSDEDDEWRTPEPPTESSLSIDLNAVLANRRAAGA
ncbi:MAG: hypothetical protein FWF28_03880 [Micrococcales bacterium]|nr:hypothetical protein [Micrococcales bacterium]